MKNLASFLFGYVDPGSGALIWQMLAAAFVGALFYFKSILRALGRLFRRITGKKEDLPPDAVAKSDPKQP